MKKFYLLVFALISFITAGFAQVSLTATGGTPTGAFTTLKDAFDAINAGTHTGSIVISINSSTTEIATCVLNGSGAGSASYTDILIKPTATATISGTTVGGRGVIELNGADNVTIDGSITTGTRDLTITNTAANTVTFTSVIRLATSTLVTNADNNTIKNLVILGSGTGRNIATVTTEPVTWGIIASAGASTVTNTTAPSALGSAATTISGTQTVANLNIDNNDIRTVSRGVAINGATATAAAGLVISSNTIGNATQGAADQVTGFGITVNGTNNGIIRDNTVRVESYFESSTPGKGIDLGSISTTGLTNVTINRNKIERVINNDGGTWPAYGINIAGGTNHIIQNNFIGDCLNSQVAGTGAFSTTFGAFGIRINSGTGHKILHNSVHFTGAVAGSINTDLVACLGIVSTASTGMDIRNNIFSNNATGGNPALYNTVLVSVYLPSGATSAMNLNLNNNAYYQGTLPYSGIAQVSVTGSAANLYMSTNFNAAAITPATNLRAYTSTLSVAGTNDNASIAFNTAPPFTSALNLHIPAATATPLESGGASVGVTTDIDGDTRPGPAGSVNGGGTLPDIGADEFDGVLASDVTAPSIAYTPLPNTCAGGNQVLTATITDASGVPVSGPGLPVLYFKINGGSYSVVTGASIGSNQYTFTFGGAAVPGDIVYYYIAAQDNVATPNVGVSPSTGAAGFTANPPAASTAPTTPGFYVYGAALTGTYTVGSGGNFPTLTAAVAQYNSACSITGPVVFSLTDATYPSETFPITISQNVAASSTNTLTIRPAAGASPLITGSVAAGPLVKILGNYVNIDGSNNGSASRNLTLSNTSTTTPNVLLIGSQGTNPVTNVSFKNTVVINGINSSSAIVISDAVAVGTAGYFNNITVQNNDVEKAYVGIFSIAVVLAGNGSGLLITKNIMTTSGANAIRFLGVYVQGADGATVSQNQMSNFNGTDSEDDKGVWLATGTTNSVVDQNKVTNLNYTGTGGYGGQGLYVSTGLTNANITVKNNILANLSGDGWSYTGIPTDNPIGIVLTGTQTGINVYYNSIDLEGNTLNQSLAMSMGILLNAGSVANIRDNIIVNNLGLLAATGYGTSAVYAATNNAQFTAIDYNDYFVTPTGSGVKAIGQIAATPQTTLAGWKTASGQDVSSNNLQPYFVSPTDLHLDPLNAGNAALDNLGTTIAGIPVDIDNQPRSGTTPDLGADEFTFGLVVPVAIEFFTGSKQGSNNLLDWKVNCTSEPSLTLVLERSSDGHTFRSINSIAATATRCLQDFNYTDVAPPAGISYYRLKVITPDGAFRYSNIVALINKDKGFELISVAPNPVRNITVLSISSVKAGMMDINVTDASGKLVMKQRVNVTAGNTTVNLDFSTLGAGTYRISAVNSDAERKTTGFVKY